MFGHDGAAAASDGDLFWTQPQGKTKNIYKRTTYNNGQAIRWTHGLINARDYSI